MPVMDQYIYSSGDNTISVNLFIGSEASFSLKAGEVTIKQVTDFPWDGEVSLSIDPPVDGREFILRIRMPAWCGNEPFAGGLYRYITPPKGKMAVKVNGSDFEAVEKSGFLEIERMWNKGDEVSVSLPMEPRFIAAREEVSADSGRVALGAGPFVFCLEEADNGKVRDIVVDTLTRLSYVYDSEFMGGSGKITFRATMPDATEREVTAIPYFLWANRGRGEMTVWIRKKS
jgi:hypothetical protein